MYISFIIIYIFYHMLYYKIPVLLYSYLSSWYIYYRECTILWIASFSNCLFLYCTVEHWLWQWSCWWHLLGAPKTSIAGEPVSSLRHNCSVIRQAGELIGWQEQRGTHHSPADQTRSAFLLAYHWEEWTTERSEPLRGLGCWPNWRHHSHWPSTCALHISQLLVLF